MDGTEPQVKQSLLRRNSLKAHAVGPIPWPDDGKHWTRQCNYLQQTSKERLEFFFIQLQQERITN
jgi:hypothetical protein